MRIDRAATDASPGERRSESWNATLYAQPTGAPHWSVRSLARAQRVSPATVYRVWRAHRLHPHRVQHLKVRLRSPGFSQVARHLRPVLESPREGPGVERR